MAHRQVARFGAPVLATTVLLVGCSHPLSSAPGQPSPSAQVLHVKPGATVDQEQLVAPNGGWVITGGRLLTTSDQGHSWTDVTPSRNANTPLLTAFFLSPSQAWAVTRSSQLNWAADNATLIFFSSTDGGQHWAARPIIATIPLDTPGPVYLTFADSLRGWLVVDQGSHGGFMYFKGFKTNDGGRTWVATSYPQSAAVRFVNQADGFSGGGVAMRPVYVTHDGGQTWAPLELPPAQGTQATAVFEPPAFSSDQEGVVAGQAWQSQDERPAEVFYTTADGGRSWTLAASVRNPDPRVNAISGGTVDRQIWFAALPPRRAPGPLPDGTLRLNVSHDAGRTWEWLPTTFAGWIHDFSFRGSTGWAIVSEAGCRSFKTDCYNNTGLFQTLDAGVHWTQLSVG